MKGGRTSFQRIQSTALVGLVILVFLWMLRYTRPLFLPIVIAILLTFILQPPVRLLRRVWIPPAVGAGIVLLLFLGVSIYAGYLVYAPAIEWTRELPEMLRHAENKLGIFKEPVEEVRRATEQVEEIARISSRDDQHVVRVEDPSLIHSITSGIGELAAGSLIGLVLIYFLLSHGDSISDKLAAVLPKPTNGKTTQGGLRTLQSRISRYLLTITAINLCEGAAVALVLMAVGMPNPILFGIMACVLNFVPYLGSMVGALIVLLVGLSTFDPVEPSLIAALSYGALSTIEGYVVTPLVLGHRFTLSPVIIFLWLLLWNWIWGVPGVLIAVPVLVTIKILSESYESLETLRTWLE